MVSFFLLFRGFGYLQLVSQYSRSVECLSLSRTHYVGIASIEREGGIAREERAIYTAHSYVDAYG